MTDPVEPTPEPEQDQPERPPWWASAWTGIAVLAGLACACSLASSDFPGRLDSDSPKLLLVFLTCWGLIVWAVVVLQNWLKRKIAHRKIAGAPRHWQYSLHTLLIVMTLGAVLCSPAKTLPTGVFGVILCVAGLFAFASIALSIVVGLMFLMDTATGFLERMLDGLVSSFNHNDPSADVDRQKDETEHGNES